MLGIDDDHTVGHTLDQCIAGHRHDVEKAVAKQPPDPQQARDGDEHRPQVQVRPRGELGHIEDVADQRHQGGDEQRAHLRPLKG